MSDTSNSSIQGYLLPQELAWDDATATWDVGIKWDQLAPPLEDDLFDAVIQQFVASITGLPGAMVRPRWQPVPPNRPALTENWAAIGVTDLSSDTFAYVEHFSYSWDTPGLSWDSGINWDETDPETRPDFDVVQRNEEAQILCSFYGPKAGYYSSRLRDGVSVAQNREALQLLDIGVIGVGERRVVPELVNFQWYRRVDMILSVRRQTLRTYPVYSLASAFGFVETEKTNTPFTVTNS